MKIQNFLKISNIFEKFEKKKFSFWSKSHFEPLEHYINIPELYLDKQSTAFYISSKNKNLNFNNIWNSIMNNKNSSLFYKTVKNNKENYTANKSEILKKIAFINLSEYDKNNDGLPFIEIWNTCIKSYETIKKHYDLSIFNKDFELTMKNSLFSKITFYSQQLHSVNLSYQKVFDSIFLEYSEKISHNNDVKIIESFASVVYDVITDYKNVMADHLVRFLKDLKTNHFRLLEEYEKSDFNISKKIIEQNRLALKYMKEINNSSIQQVSIAIKKRDILQEISFYSSYRKKLIKKNVYYIKSIIKKLTGEKKNLKIMLKNLINDDIKWLEVYKNLLIKRKLIKFWKKHIHNVVYLKNNMIFDLENFVDQEVKIFSESRFFPILKSNKDKRYKLSRIRQIINYEFDIPIDFYTSESYKTDKSIEKEMNILLKKKDKIDKLVFVKKDTLNEPSKIFNFEQSIKLAQAEVKWSDESQNKLFSLFLSNKEIKVSRLEKNIKSYKKTVAPLLNYFESVISSHENAKQLLELETVKDIKSFRKLFAFKEWSLNLLINLSRYTSSKSSVSKKLEIDYLAALEFIRLYESLSINIEKMFLPYKKLKLGEKFKLKFVKYHLNGAKFLFVQDDNSISYEEKKEILRTLGNISKSFSSSFIFITDDLKIINELFEEVYFFDDFKLLEWGSKNEIQKLPVNPTIAKLYNPEIKIPNFNDYYKNNDYYINDSYIQVKNKNHFISSSLHDYEYWLSKKYLDTKEDPHNKTGKSLCKNNTKRFIANHIKGYFDDVEIYLDDVNSNYYENFNLNDNFLMNDYLNHIEVVTKENSKTASDEELQNIF